MVTVNDRPYPWRDGLTLADLLARFEDGHVYAVVKLNGRLVSRPNFEHTPVPDGSTVIPIPMIAGG